MKISILKESLDRNFKRNKKRSAVFSAFVLLLCAAFLFVGIPMIITTTSAADDCGHEHDGTCGFALAVPCDHEHDTACGFTAESPCTYVHIHNDECGFDGDENLPCLEPSHIHNDSCGYITYVMCAHTCSDGTCSFTAASPCGHECDPDCDDTPEDPGNDNDSLIGDGSYDKKDDSENNTNINNPSGTGTKSSTQQFQSMTPPASDDDSLWYGDVLPFGIMGMFEDILGMSAALTGPPVIDTATVIENGTEISILFEDDIKTNTGSAPDGFTISVDGTTSIAVTATLNNPNGITLSNITPAIKSGQAVEVNYIKPADNYIQSTDDDDFETSDFSGVDNGSLIVNIISQPSAQVITFGGTATFAIDASPAPSIATYQWKSSATVDGTYGNISSANAATYSLTPTNRDLNGYYFRCDITTSQGTVESTPVQLTINQASIADATIELMTPIIYNGNPWDETYDYDLEVKLPDGTELTRPSDYIIKSVTGEGGNTTNAGNLTITIQGAGNYDPDTEAFANDIVLSPKNITITGWDVSKVYDSGTTLGGGSFGTLVFNPGEFVTPTATGIAETANVDSSLGTATFTHANVEGVSNDITIGGTFTMTSGTATPSNYSIQLPAANSFTGTITPAPLEFQGLIHSKPYDGTNTIDTTSTPGPGVLTITPAFNLGPWLNGADSSGVSITYTAEYTDIDAGTDTIDIAVSAFTGNTNYEIPVGNRTGIDVTGGITKRPLEFKDLTHTKIFDNSTSIDATGPGELIIDKTDNLDGWLSTDAAAATFSFASAAYTSVNATTNTINISGVTLTGADNYEIPTANTSGILVTGGITAKQLTLLDIEHYKSYDGTQTLTGLTFSKTNIGGWITGDPNYAGITIGAPTVQYTSPNAGTDTISISGITLGATGASNYIAPADGTVDATGTPKGIIAGTLTVDADNLTLNLSNNDYDLSTEKAGGHHATVTPSAGTFNGDITYSVDSSSPSGSVTIPDGKTIEFTGDGDTAEIRVTVDGDSNFEDNNSTTFTLTVTASGITLSPTSLDFGSVVQGAATPSAQTVTITNNGASNTGLLTITSSAGGSSMYTAPTITPNADIAIGSTGTFTIQPSSTATVGTHTEVLTVTNGTDISSTLSVTFTVTEAPTWSIGLTPTTQSFGPSAFGYTQLNGETITITNTGNQPTGALTVALSGTNETDFVLSNMTIASISAGSTGNTASFTVRPVNGLGFGTYNATITVAADTGSGVTLTQQTVAVSFSVTQATPSVTFPTGLTATYGQTLTNVTLPAITTPVPGTLSWVPATSTPVGDVGNRSHDVLFTPANPTNFTTVTGSVNINVTQANPVTQWPTNLTAVYGQTLASVSVTPPGNGTASTAGTWAWVQPTTTVITGSVGTPGQHELRFTPGDTANYTTPTQNVPIALTVATIETANTNITEPVRGAAPSAVASNGTGFTATFITWRDSSGVFTGSFFEPNEIYTAEVTLNATAPNYLFATGGAFTGTINGNPPTNLSTDESTTKTMTFEFPETAAADTPGVPQAFLATAGDGQVALTWTAPANNGGAVITKYQVSSDNGVTWVDATSATGHTFTELTNGTLYSFKVRAVNSEGSGDEATTTATPVAPADTTDPTDPSAPGGGANIVTGGSDGSVQIPFTSGNGGSTVTLMIDTPVLNQLIAAAANNNVRINLRGVSGARAAELPAAALAEIAAQSLGTQLEMPQGTITLNAAATAALAGQAGGANVTLSLFVQPPTALSTVQQNAYTPASGDVILSITATANGQNITNFFGGTLTITVPYSGPLPATVYYMDGNGNLTAMPTTYDAASGTVTFRTTHLSTYIIRHTPRGSSTRPPQTGDYSNTPIWRVVLITSALGIIFTITLKKHISKRHRWERMLADYADFRDGF
ncbi:MAG: fibronectin type III domain-containing protein [Oscillospiraceae bacterium]|nr:fibronectin type III domain-containing protein [Oscillospiraceae bacterium]